MDGDVNSKSQQHVAGKYNNDANDAAEMGGVHHMSKVAALRMWWSGESNPHLNAASNSEEQRLLASLPYILALVGAGVLLMVGDLLMSANCAALPRSPIPISECWLKQSSSEQTVDDRAPINRSYAW